MNTDRTIAQLALSLYASAKRVERLPVVTTYFPTEVVTIVEAPAHLSPALALAFFISPRFEEI